MFGPNNEMAPFTVIFICLLLAMFFFYAAFTFVGVFFACLAVALMLKEW